MEDNNNLNGQDPQGVEGTPTDPTPDYKALYEKLQKDNANLDKYNKDLKAKYQAKLTDEEKARAGQEEREAYYKQLEKENKSIKLKSELSKTIADETLISSISDSFLNDDINGALAKMSEYYSNEKLNMQKKLDEQNLLKNPTPPPSAGNVPKMTQKEFNSLSTTEKVKLKNENYELYKQLAK